MLPHKNSQKRYYLENAIYFVTTKTAGNYPYFRNQVLAEYIVEVIKMGCEDKKCILFGFVILPDRLHLLVQPTGKYNISDFMHYLKRHSSRNIRILISQNLAGSQNNVGGDGHPRLQGGIWQKSYHDHVIRDETDFENHIAYLRHNPMKHGALPDKCDNYPYLFIDENTAIKLLDNK